MTGEPLQSPYTLDTKADVVDDADANHDDEAGSMIFLARSCVELRSGDTCDTGLRNGQAVTVCRSPLHTAVKIFSPISDLTVSRMDAMQLSSSLHLWSGGHQWQSSNYSTHLDHCLTTISSIQI